MNYYTTSQYKERWYVEFYDLYGGLWHVGIEDPTYTGTTSRQLIGSDNPLEWMGKGDDDQTKCVLGSTGYLRIMVRDYTDADGVTDEAALADLRPTEINNRRVSVKCDSTFMWQGFLKMEDYDQDWLPTPYEIELPIHSALELAGSFSLPDYQTACAYGRMYISDMLRYLVWLMGVDITTIRSNRLSYRDYNNDDHGGAEWTQGRCMLSYFYDKGDCEITPNTVKDVLETLLFPYGHLREMGQSWAITFDNGGTHLYSTTVPEQEGTFVPVGTYLLTKESSDWATVYLNNSSKTYYQEQRGDDNKASNLQAPNKVSWGVDTDGSSKVFSMSAKWLNKDTVFTYPSSETTKDYTQNVISKLGGDDDTLNFAVENINPDNIDADYRSDITINDTDRCFYSRVIKYSRSDDGASDAKYKKYSFTETMPLGFGMSQEDQHSHVLCTIMLHNIITRVYFNKLKISTKMWNAEGVDEEDDSHEMYISIRCGKGTEDYPYMYYSITDQKWTSTASICFFKNLPNKQGNEYYLYLHSYYGTGTEQTTDDAYKDIEILYGISVNLFYIHQFFQPTVEYVKDEGRNNDQNATRLIKEFMGGSEYKDFTTEIGGGGGDIDVKFKTLAGRYYKADDGAADMPTNGFLDVPGKLDTLPRKKLEINACRVPSKTPFLAVHPFVVTDGTTTYFPAAVGMNAHDGTTHLILIEKHSISIN